MIYITHSGIEIDISNFREENIRLEDIAHHLTKICRFGGALSLGIHYSVAEHSLLMTKYALKHYSKDVARAALLHDATEAYLGDIVSGLKMLLPDYLRIEKAIEKMIVHRYDLDTSPETKRLVKRMDTRILLDEAKQLMPDYYDTFAGMYEGYEPLGVKITAPKNHNTVKTQFLDMCEELL